MTRFLLVLSLAMLLACDPRGAVTLSSAAVGVGKVEHVFIGTTRVQAQDGSFGSRRSEEVRFARYDVSVPPVRELGAIKWPRHGTGGNPQTDFLTTDEEVYQSSEAFRADLRRPPLPPVRARRHPRCAGVSRCDRGRPEIPRRST